MLEIDESRLAECNLTDGKLKADPSVPGRFIYTVDAQRSTERTFGTGSALKKDGTLLDNGGSVDQAGERKRLPFLTGEVVSAGDITVSLRRGDGRILPEDLPCHERVHPGYHSV